MFSTVQKDFIEWFIPNQIYNGYEYYLVHTNTNLSSSYQSYDFVDLTIYVSSNPLEFIDGKLNGTDCVRYDVITRNVSNSDYDSKIDRIVTTNLNSLNVNIDEYEHIATNLSDNYMDCVATVQYDLSTNIGYNIDLNDYYIIPTILVISLLMTWLFSWFGRIKGGNL